MTEQAAGPLTGISKVLKDSDWVSLAETAILFWAITAAIGYFDTDGKVFAIASQTIVVTFAILCTAWASIKFFSALNRKIDHRRTLRNLATGSKNHLINFFKKGFRIQNLDSYNQHVLDLIAAGIFEYVDAIDNEFRIAPDYWELLHKEGEKLLFSGKQKPNVSWPDGM